MRRYNKKRVSGLLDSHGVTLRWGIILHFIISSLVQIITKDFSSSYMIRFAFSALFFAIFCMGVLGISLDAWENKEPSFRRIFRIFNSRHPLYGWSIALFCALVINLRSILMALTGVQSILIDLLCVMLFIVCYFLLFLYAYNPNRSPKFSVRFFRKQFFYKIKQLVFFQIKVFWWVPIVFLGTSILVGLMLPSTKRQYFLEGENMKTILAAVYAGMAFTIGPRFLLIQAWFAKSMIEEAE